MDDTTAPVSPPLSVPRTLRTLAVLKVVTANFAVLSTASLLLGVVCSTLFLFGYLSVFDWTLIWIVEYGDILKFGLVAVAMLSTFVLSIQGVIINTINVHDSTGKARWILLAILGALALSILGTEIYSQHTSAEPQYQRAVTYSLGVIFLTFWIVDITQLVANKKPPPLREISNMIFFAIFSITTFGACVGVFVRYSTTSHDVYLRDRTLTDVRVVMFTSHHTVLFSDKVATVVPTPDVVQMVSKPPRKQ
jgi:hypothetical protein